MRLSSNPTTAAESRAAQKLLHPLMDVQALGGPPLWGLDHSPVRCPRPPPSPASLAAQSESESSGAVSPCRHRRTEEHSPFSWTSGGSPWAPSQHTGLYTQVVPLSRSSWASEVFTKLYIDIKCFFSIEKLETCLREERGLQARTVGSQVHCALHRHAGCPNTHSVTFPGWNLGPPRPRNLFLLLPLEPEVPPSPAPGAAAESLQPWGLKEEPLEH